MTPQERKYICRHQIPIEKKTDYKKWFVDVLIALAIAIAAAITIIGLAVAIVFITPGAHAVEIESNEYYCRQIAEGKANVAPEYREEVSAYCANL